MGTATITEWDMAKWQAVADSNAVSLTVDFDPQSLELSYTTTGSAAGVQSKPSGTWNKTASQQTGQSATLSVTLLFDTTTTDGVSVQTRTDPLVMLTLPHDLTQEGPKRRVVCFQWGTFLFFGCVESMTQTIDFFSDAGVPLRASVHLSIVQVGRPDTPSGAGGPGPSQSFGANAGIGASASFSAGASASAGASFGAGASAGAGASFGAGASAGVGASFGAGASAGVGASFGAGASAGIGTTPLTLSQDGDTIQGIVARSGGSVSWKAVAIANNIDNPRLLPPGTVLSVNAGAQLSAGLG
jgi:Contractile injection system tube protein/LysM domain